MRNFLPDYNALPVGGRYRPIYKLFAEENWRQVFKDEKPVLCDSSLEAIKIAKERVKEILNSQIRVEHYEEVEADILGIEDWRRQKEESAVAEKARVFGDKPAEIVFARNGKQVKVERTNKRRWA